MTPVGVNNSTTTRKETTVTLTNNNVSAHIYAYQAAKPYITFNELNPSITCNWQGTGQQGVDVQVQSTNRSRSEWTLTPSHN